jgi:CheY-like chemotaxis protein
MEDYQMLLEQLNCVYYPTLNPLLYPFGRANPNDKRIKRVLIIDDDQEMNVILREFLRNERGIKTVFAEDPFEAMNQLNQQVFDTIILDWNLPEMSGPDTLARTEQFFRSDPNLPFEWEDKKTKVVIMTGKDRIECRTSNTKHFRYSGFIDKRKHNAKEIAENIIKFALKETT